MNTEKILLTLSGCLLSGFAAAHPGHIHAIADMADHTGYPTSAGLLLVIAITVLAYRLLRPRRK